MKIIWVFSAMLVSISVAAPIEAINKNGLNTRQATNDVCNVVNALLQEAPNVSSSALLQAVTAVLPGTTLKEVTACLEYKL